MRAIVAKKLRKYARRNWIEYVKALKQWPFMSRLKFAWYIVKPEFKRGRRI